MYDAGAAGTALGDIRFIGDLPGRYVLSSRNGPDQQVKVFACRSRSISPQRMVLQGPVRGAAGEGVAARFDELGLLRGIIAYRTPDGFVADLQASEAEQARLAGRIAWLKRRVTSAGVDRREDRRWPPRNPRSTLQLPDQPALECFIIDVSASGAALSADVVPADGTPLTIGTIEARVVRRLEVGFAVQFLVRQDPAGLEAQLAAAGSPP